VASVFMIIRVYGKTLVLWPTTRNARAGSQSTIPPMLTERRRARATIALMDLAGEIVTAGVMGASADQRLRCGSWRTATQLMPQQNLFV
jgi:hypothetical protein